MIKAGVVLLIIASIVILAGAYFFVSVGMVQQSGNSIKSLGTGQTTQNMPVKFSTSPDYQYSHEITNPLSADAKTAITGFQLSIKTNSDGSITYIFTAIEQNYVNQTYTIKPGQRLYFIERSMGDDNAGSNTDYNLKDDYAVIVDASGYIVR